MNNRKKSVNDIKVNCNFCNRTTNMANIKKHEHGCFLNPKNKKDCPVCGTIIKNYKTSTTCSHKCSNTFFRTGPQHPNWKKSQYRTTCFFYHKKECVICQEVNIVAVHHLDENHKNNDPSNLIPLCPTHHSYCHSNFKHLIIEKINNYISDWRQQRGG